MIAEQAATLDASSMAAAESYYENTVRLGVNIKRPRDVRKTSNWSRFQQIARKCIIAKVDVRRFVTAAFEDTILRHPMVTVQDICQHDPKTVFRSQDGIANATPPKDLWNLLSCKLLDIAFAVGTDESRSRIAFLDSPTYGFPAWFRVFFPEVPSPDIIVHWGDLAYEELLEDPALETYLKGLRPKTSELLKSVVSQLDKGNTSE